MTDQARINGPEHPALVAAWAPVLARFRERWREWLGLFLLNGAFSLLISLGFILGVSSGLYGMALYSLPMATISQAFFLNLAPLILSGCLFFPIKNRFWARLSAGFIYFLLQFALVADVIVFRLFHRHFDGVIWDTITAPGIGDSIHVGWQSHVVAALLVLALGGAVGAMSLRLAPALAKRRLTYIFIPVLVCVLWERAVYAIGDLNDHLITYWVQEQLPLYRPLTIRKICARLGVKFNPFAAVTQPDTSSSLIFPRHPITFEKSPPRPNIVFVFIDSARSDGLQPKVMPFLWNWKEDAVWLRRHFSSGNGTGEGIFGALYGVPGAYLPRIFARAQTSPLLETLASLAYDFSILSCADLRYPAFRPTIFARWTNQITDHWDCPRVAREREMTDVFLNFVKAHARRGREDKPPFFAFLNYDAAHQPYHCLPEFLLNPTDETEPEINYARLAAFPSEASKIRKDYDNALHYIDHEIGRLIQGLKEQQVYDNSIIVILGDHGEAFGECGQYGHNSNYSRYQTQTLALVRFPDWHGQTLDRLTSHCDFVPSIFLWMHATNPLDDYTTGLPLQKDNQRTFALSCGRDSYAVIKTNGVTVFNRYVARHFDTNYVSIKPDDSRAPNAKELMQSMRDLEKFYK